jgi:hypothetical protein
VYDWQFGAIRGLREFLRLSVEHRLAARSAKKVLFALVFANVLCCLFIDVHIANGIFWHFYLAVPCILSV